MNWSNTFQKASELTRATFIISKKRTKQAHCMPSPQQFAYSGTVDPNEPLALLSPFISGVSLVGMALSKELVGLSLGSLSLSILGRILKLIY